MRQVWSPLQRDWQQKRHFPITVIDLVDCYGSPATVSIRWAEEVPGNMHQILKAFIESKKPRILWSKEISRQIKKTCEH